MLREKDIWSSEHKGQVGEYKKFSELTPAEWRLVAKQFAYALYIVPVVFSGVLGVVTNPQVLDKVGMGLDTLKRAIAGKMPDGYSIRKAETPNGKVISIVDKRAEKADQFPKISLEIVLPNPEDLEKKLTFQFRGLKLPEITALLDDTPTNTQPIQSAVKGK